MNLFNQKNYLIKQDPDFQTAFNLMLCLYALGEPVKMKDCFIAMISIEIPGLSEEDEDELDKDRNPQVDILKEDVKEKKREIFKYIVNTSKLIAPVIENDIIKGFDWIIEAVNSSSYAEIESEIEICRAMAYLKRKNIEKAIETLKGFEKKDKIMVVYFFNFYN